MTRLPAERPRGREDCRASHTSGDAVSGPAKRAKARCPLTTKFDPCQGCPARSIQPFMRLGTVRHPANSGGFANRSQLHAGGKVRESEVAGSEEREIPVGL